MFYFAYLIIIFLDLAQIGITPNEYILKVHIQECCN